MGAENRAATPFDLPNDPTLEDLLRVWARQIKLGIRTAVPATVVAMDPATATVTVLVGILPVVKLDDPLNPPARMLAPKGVPPNQVAVLQPIQLTGVPVFVYGNQLNYVSVPLVTGDTGLLHVCDRSLEHWMQTGQPSDPVLAFTHALKDSAFYPGVRPKPKVTAIDPAATVVEGAQVKLGKTAASVAIKGTEFVTFMDAGIAAAITAGSGSPGSGAAAFTAFQTAWNAAKVALQSTKVKVE